MGAQDRFSNVFEPNHCGNTNSMFRIVAIPCVLAGNTYEYVAFVPNGGGPRAKANSTIEWVKLEYPETGPTSSLDVTVTPVSQATPELGSWYDLGMGSDVKGAMLTAKIRESNMYTYVNTGKAPTQAGCCADTMRVYPKGSTSVTDIDLESVMQEVFPGNSFAHATHTFDLTMLDGELHALAMVQYNESDLGGVKADSVVAVRLGDGSVRQTSLGEKHFSIFQNLGTMSESVDETRFKIQYGSGRQEEWHGNGVNRFQALDGTWILAITQRFANGAVLIKDPFTYSSAEGGGKVLQRFGTPAIYSGGSASSYHYFGMENAAGHISSGVHNLWHNVYGDHETLTMFVNGMSSDSLSHAYEFDVKLTDETKAVASDAAFATDYTDVAFKFQARAQGGARALGNTVIIGASGAALTGFEIADANGGSQTISYTQSLLYDPFVRVVPADFLLV